MYGVQSPMVLPSPRTRSRWTSQSCRPAWSMHSGQLWRLLFRKFQWHVCRLSLTFLFHSQTEDPATWTGITVCICSRALRAHQFLQSVLPHGSVVHGYVFNLLFFYNYPYPHIFLVDLALDLRRASVHPLQVLLFCLA